MAKRRKAAVDTAADLLQGDPEAARELLEIDKKDRAQGDVQRPPQVDPRHGDQSVAPGHDDVPAGGTSGSNIRSGGMGKRSG